MPITKVTPEMAYVGDEILIEGNDLGAGAMRNTIHFNGVQAFPTEWAPDHIKVIVPDGATSGPISIVNDGNVTEIGYVLFGGTSVATARAASEDKKNQEYLAKTDQQKTAQPGGGAGPHEEVVSGVPVHNVTGAGGGASQKTASDLNAEAANKDQQGSQPAGATGGQTPPGAVGDKTAQGTQNTAQGDKAGEKTADGSAQKTGKTDQK